MLEILPEVDLNFKASFVIMTVNHKEVIVLKVDIFNTDKKYEVIYADPPWRYSDRKCNGACEFHYETMKLEEIKKLPIPQIADKNCVLFLWTTYPMLREALELIEAWGFTYKSIGFQWIKKNKSGKGWFFGLGRWTRGNTEPCLIAVKGKPQRERVIKCHSLLWSL